MNSTEENEQGTKLNQTLQHIQVKNRTITLSYSQSEIEEVNEILTELQTNRGLGSDTMKGLFLQILRNSVKEIQNSSENSNEISTELKDELIFKDAEISRLQGEISTLQTTQQELVQSIEQLGNIEIETVEVEKKTDPKETDVYIELSSQETLILQTIADNRFVKRYDAEKESISQVAKKLIFNKATLYNWAGEIYTGL